MMQLLGTAGSASLGYYLIFDPSSFEMTGDVTFNDIVIASDDTIICAGNVQKRNSSNWWNYVASFNTSGELQNTRMYYDDNVSVGSSGFYFPPESGPSLAINSSDRISMVAAINYNVPAGAFINRWGCTVLNKNLTTAMSTSNRFTYAGDRTATGDGDFVFARTSLGNDDKMYWTTAFTDNSQPQYKILQNSKTSSVGNAYHQAQGSSAPAMVNVANDKLAVCYAPDQNNTGASRIGVIDANYGSAASSDENLIWKASMDFGSGQSSSPRINDIVYDGSTYLYAVAHNGVWSTSADTGKSVGIIKVAASNGALQWQKKYQLNSLTALNGNAGYLNGISCALDTDGNLFFIGEGGSAALVASSEHVVFGKILANGNFSWCHQLKWDSATSLQSGQTYTRAGNFNNGRIKNGIACDSTGAVYIATSARPVVSGSVDSNNRSRAFLIKVNNDGTTVGDFGDFVISEANSVSNITTGLDYNTANAGAGDRFLYGDDDSEYTSSYNLTVDTATSIGSTEWAKTKL